MKKLKENLLKKLIIGVLCCGVAGVGAQTFAGGGDEVKKTTSSSKKEKNRNSKEDKNNRKAKDKKNSDGGASSKENSSEGKRELVQVELHRGKNGKYYVELPRGSVYENEEKRVSENEEGTDKGESKNRFLWW